VCHYVEGCCAECHYPLIETALQNLPFTAGETIDNCWRCRSASYHPISQSQVNGLEQFPWTHVWFQCCKTVLTSSLTPWQSKLRCCKSKLGCLKSAPLVQVAVRHGSNNRLLIMRSRVLIRNTLASG